MNKLKIQFLHSLKNKKMNDIENHKSVDDLLSLIGLLVQKNMRNMRWSNPLKTISQVRSLRHRRTGNKYWNECSNWVSLSLFVYVIFFVNLYSNITHVT